MSVVQKMVGMVLRPIAEWQARGRSGEAFAAALERSGANIAARFAGASDTPGNREAVNHITGLERWGQRRLRVALGEPPVMDSYRGYRLPEGSDVKTLAQAFADTRRETAALALELGRAGFPVALGARRTDRLEEVAAHIRADGGEAVVHPLDLTDDDSVAAFANAVQQYLGDIEVVVSNAGAVAPGTITAITTPG